MKTRELNAVQEQKDIMENPRMIKNLKILHRDAKDLFEYIDCSEVEFFERIGAFFRGLNNEKVLKDELLNKTPEIEHSELGHAAFVEETGHDPEETDLLFVEATKKRVLELLGDAKVKRANY